MPIGMVWYRDRRPREAVSELPPVVTDYELVQFTGSMGFTPAAEPDWPWRFSRELLRANIQKRLKDPDGLLADSALVQAERDWETARRITRIHNRPIPLDVLSEELSER
jgi:hypothetical protein